MKNCEYITSLWKFHFSLITMLWNIDYNVSSRSKTSVPLLPLSFIPSSLPDATKGEPQGFALRSLLNELVARFNIEIKGGQ